MYGTIFRMKVKAGHEDDAVQVFQEWEKEHRPKVDGALGGYLLKPEKKSGELIGVAVFRDQDSYRKNAERPEQDAWFRKLREHLEADPDWEDGEYVAGGPG